MYYAEYNNSVEEDEISIKLKNEYKNINYTNTNTNIVSNNIQPVYDNYFKPQSGFCNMSFGGLIKENKTSTIVIAINADLNYDNDCKMGHYATLLIPVTVPEITEKSPVVIIPVVTQQNIDATNNNIVSTAIHQPILEAKIENDKITVKPIDDIAQISENAKIVTAVTNINETPNKIETTTISSLPVTPEENKKVVTESNIINTDISGSLTKTNTNIVISQTCLNGTLECDVKQQINDIKSDVPNNYNTYSQSSRTIVDLPSGKVDLYKMNERQNMSTVPTTFINNSNNSDINNNIMLVNENNSLKVVIPTDAPAIVKVGTNGQVINTTSEPVKIITKEPFVVKTLIERFTSDNGEGGYNVFAELKKMTDGIVERLPPLQNLVNITN
jgi:hypothetical protein